jgi:cold shock protein
MNNFDPGQAPGFSKAYGFIVPDDGSSDVFMHIKDAARCKVGALSEGQRPSYDQQGSDGRSNATDQKLLGVTSAGPTTGMLWEWYAFKSPATNGMFSLGIL